MNSKTLIMGLSGSGKTALTKALAPRLDALVFNGDEIRATVSRGLGFSHEDRVEHARRMGWLCDRVVETGATVIADFICPTPETRAAFADAFVIWVDRIKEGRFADTSKLFVPPAHYAERVTVGGTRHEWAERIVGRLRPMFDPTHLFHGRGVEYSMECLDADDEVNAIPPGQVWQKT